MKNFRFLFAIAAIALVTFSAFTRPKKDTTFYANVGGAPKAVLASQEGITWHCIGGTNYCVYLDQALTMPRETTQTYLFKTIP